jgi:membrane protein YdbS with pleckstrin-like domain
MSQNRRERRTLLFILGWLLCGFIVLSIDQPMVANLAIAPWLAIAWLIVILAVFIIPLSRLMKTREKSNSAEEAEAIRQWTE